MRRGVSPTTRRSRRWTCSISSTGCATKHFPARLSSLAEGVSRADNKPVMRRLEVVPQELPLHPQDEVECRRCGVHCDKVVYPSACVERGCPFLYSFVELGRTYVGCMQKVFDVEIDLGLMLEAEDRGEFGAVRANRKPLPM